MQDHIPDALITAFERQYDSSWNDPKLRNERLAMRYGWAAAIEQKQCLFQIQEPTVNQQLTVAPMAAMTNALREAEAALEVAMARILKADPGYSISVTSEAKALVAVRQALSAQAAPVAVGEREAFEAAFIAEKLRMIGCNESDSEAVRAIRMCHLQRYGDGEYPSLEAYFAWFAWQAGRAALAAKPGADAPTVPKWIDDPHDIEQGQILNPEWVKLQEEAAAPVVLPEPFALYDGEKWYANEEAAICSCADMAKLQKVFIESQLLTLLAGVSAPAGAVPDGWREKFATDVYNDLAAADNQDVPLEEYPARILKVLDSIVGPRHPVVIKWRNDAVRSCIAIAYKYCRDPESQKYLKQDLEAMLTAEPAPQQADARDAAPAAPYSLDADPLGIRELAASAITGALCFGAAGGEKPPAGHWLEWFYNAGAEKAPASSEQDARYIAIGKAIERACAEQPQDTEIIISLERDAGTVSMFDPDGNEHDYFQCDDGFAGVVNQAIDAAIAAQAAQQGGAA